MNKHTKLAVMLAPFLAIGGYIASGYYVDEQNKKERFLKLESQGECKILQGNCELTNGKFRLNISQKEGITHLATTHPIDHAVISLVLDNQQEKLYKLVENKDRFNWQTKTDLSDKSKIRLLITISKTSYLAELDIN